MNLENLKLLFLKQNCSYVYVKHLSANDNSKNQVYFGGNFESLNIFPISSIKNEAAGEWKKERFKAKINFSWINEEGAKSIAPDAQLILYPSYPEVRFSGFLNKCQNSPSELMTQRTPNRILFLGISRFGEVIGYVTGHDSDLANEYNGQKFENGIGIFQTISLESTIPTKIKLLNELKRIHNLDWINSKRLNSSGEILECLSPNCGGYTLEAELGIKPNGYSEPDYLGWEIKQFSVSNFNNINSSVITLMTPEPTDGDYKNKGVDYFIRKYGYPDLNGKIDRLNFGGIHKVGDIHPRTNLRLELVGFDISSNKIRNTDGFIGLIDQQDNIAASWDFASLLLHWNRKHNQACFVPSISELLPVKKYKFGNQILLGEGTDFQLFLSQMAVGNIYYDPGIKMENASTNQKIKKRSQFRIKSNNLSKIYKNSSLETLTP
jgi:hypothetical protein